MIVNIEPADFMLFINICFFMGNMAIHFGIRKLEKAKINSLIESNICSSQSVSLLVDTLDSAIQQKVLDNAVAKATEEILIE